MSYSVARRPTAPRTREAGSGVPVGLGQTRLQLDRCFNGQAAAVFTLGIWLWGVGGAQRARQRRRQGSAEGPQGALRLPATCASRFRARADTLAFVCAPK